MIEIGKLWEEIPLRAFLGNDSEFLMKDGSVGAVLVANPHDPECMEDEEMDSMSDRLAATWRIFDPRFRAYQYLVRTLQGDGLYRNSTYVVIVRLKDYASAGPSLFPRQAALNIKSGLEKRQVELKQRVDSWRESCADIWPLRQATKEEAFSLFWGLFNAGVKVPKLQGDLDLDEQVHGSEILFGGQPYGVIAVGGEYASIVSLKFLPESKESTVYMLEPLASAEAEFIACVQSQDIPFDQQQRSVRHSKNSEIDKETSTSGKLQSEKTGSQLPERMLNHQAVRNVEALSQAQSDIAEGNYYGWFQLSIMVRSRTIEELLRSREAVKTSLDVKVRMEIEGTLRKKPMFFSFCPGAHRCNFREKKISNLSRSHFSFLFGVDQGNPYSAHLGSGAVKVFETRQKTPYHFNFHAGTSDVGHLLITGKTGSGKTVLMKSLIAAAQKYKPYTSITDFAGTYKLLTEQCGGYYRRIEIGSDAARMNPLAWPDSKEQRDFATALVALLIEQRGQRLDADQIEDIHQGVVRFYESDEPKRLGAVVPFLPDEFRRTMRRWVEPGQYSWLLDNEETESNDNDFQCREFVGFDDEDHKELLEPLFMAKFHMDTMRIRDPNRMGQLKLLPNDEAWVMAKSPRGMDYLRGGLKRARMYNAVFILATQAPRDASASPLWPVINQCCDKIMLADPEMTEAEYASDFGLRPKQVEMVRGLIPKKQLFIRNAGSYGKVVGLVLSEKERLLYATDSPTLKLRQEAEEKYGPNFLEHLLGGNGNGNGNGADRQIEGRNGANHSDGWGERADFVREERITNLYPVSERR